MTAMPIATWTKLATVPDHAGMMLEKQTRRLMKKKKLIVNVQTTIDLNVPRSLVAFSSG